MAVIPPPPEEWGPFKRLRVSGRGRVSALMLGVGGVLAVVVLAFCYVWFVMRVEVRAGEVLVLVRKVGEQLPGSVDTQTVLYPALLDSLNEPADSCRYKGIMYDVLSEGRYFYDPFLWERRTFPSVIIGQDEVGLLVRKYGQPLPPGKIVATGPEERGPLAEVLMPGRYNINPYAYDLRRVVPEEVPAGFVGVQRLYHGHPAADPNGWTVASGEIGVQPDVLPPGRYYNNPYARQINLIDVRSHTLDLRDEGAIRFPSADSFEIVLEATVEYAIRQDMAPYVMVAIGDHSDIEDKLILPYARSLSRIEGSKLLAREFISGETRQAFQNAFFQGLRDQCAAQGIEIKATPIRRIEPPAAIANPISDRQIADQRIKQYENEIKLAESQAKLVEQEEMQQQQQAIGLAQVGVVGEVTDADKRKAVALLEAQQELEVAKLHLKEAEERSAAILSRGQAEAEVLLLKYQAEAEPLRSAVAAFGGGDTYAQHFFYQKLGPALKSILASTDGPLADVFRALGNPVQAPATEGGAE